MRILALTSLYPNPWQPHRATFNRQQFAALAVDHELHIIAPVSWTDQLRSTHRGSDERAIIRDGVMVEHPRYYFPPGCFRSHHARWYERSVRHSFDRAVDAFSPDVVLAAWAYPDVAAARELCSRYRLPLVAKVHGSDVLLPPSGSTRQRQTAEALRAANAVITVSKQLTTRVAGFGVPLDRVYTVYNGVDPSLFSPALHKGHGNAPAKLLFVGNLVAVKGIDTLLAACVLLLRNGVDFTCDLIGQGPLQRTIDKQIRAMGLSGRVQLLGPQPLHTLSTHYRSADVLVLPSRSEGVPNVVLEAIACGTPVVATRVGGIPEILEPHSLVEPDRPEELARVIQRAIDSPRPSAFKPRSWTESARQIADVLASVIPQHRKAAA